MPAVLHKRRSRRSSSTSSRSSTAQPGRVPEEQGDSKTLSPRSSRSLAQLYQGSQRAGKNYARARKELCNRARLWAFAGAPVPDLPCPSPSTERTQQGSGADPARTLAQPHRHAHARGTFSPVCMLCHRTEADTDICGYKRMKFKLCVHNYCQVSSLRAPSNFLPRRGLPS